MPKVARVFMISFAAFVPVIASAVAGPFSIAGSASGAPKSVVQLADHKPKHKCHIMDGQRHCVWIK